MLDLSFLIRGMRIMEIGHVFFLHEFFGPPISLDFPAR